MPVDNFLKLWTRGELNPGNSTVKAGFGIIPGPQQNYYIIR